MRLVKICSREGCFNVKSIGAEGEVVSMDKFEEIQQLTQQLHVHGGPNDENDSSSDKENGKDKDSDQTCRLILRSLLYYFWHKDTSKLFVHNNNHAYKMKNLSVNLIYN